ncbi:electron transport protein [Mesobacillus maritimus]|uniref:electron transport protein n=1 Tax=Mesobacillus maritimus TaxID=1643336 RepID=UPI002040A56C|nr:electron transport protein [Mesobacillus maritimus]MCM3667948.1 electron transport protein [Mesobacillus maritimus]
MKRFLWVFFSVFFLGVIGYSAFQFVDFDYAYTPPDDKLMAYQVNERNSYDLWGEHITDQQAKELEKTEDGREKLKAENGAVKIDQDLIDLGRKTFYEETFGNEYFFTDIMGVLDGPITFANISKAILALKGEGTNNLQIELAEDITIGNKTYKKGDKIDTGLDVVKGSHVPLGMPVSVDDGRVRIGVSCAACHATVDPDTKKIIEGAPNQDFNVGLMLALATNSTAFFTHTDVENIKEYIVNHDRTIANSKGKQEALPDAEKLEKKVDETFANWPKGSVDSTIDLVGNPAQIPDSFTLHDHPYGWTGFAMAGPFKGLTVFSHNVHSQNTDSLSQTGISEDLLGIDKEVYLATILQNAVSEEFRFAPDKNQKPSEFFKTVDPTPNSVGINESVTNPEYPKVSLLAPDGVIINSPGYKFSMQMNGAAAFQNSIQPPKPKEQYDGNTVKVGRKVFERANCISCHAGNALTNHKIIPVQEIKTEPSRAKAHKKTEKIFGEPLYYSPDTPVPLPKNPRILKVPIKNLDPEQIKLAYAHGDSLGGYKVPSIIGLYWTAPYLHDGGVAVGSDLETELGVPGTLANNKLPDPANSLRALVDKTLRAKVIEANQQDTGLKQVHITGEGHEFWVDESTGFTKEEQDQLIQYLLSLSTIEDRE